MASPTSPLMAKGIRAFQAGRPEEALACFLQLASQDPGSLAAFNALGNVHLHLGQMAEAEAAYRQALRLQPECAEVHYNLAGILKSQDRFDEAEAHGLQALRAKPGWGDAHNQLGLILLARRRWPEAEACFRRALELGTSPAEAWNNLGVALLEQSRLDEAAQAYHQATLASPSHLDAWINLGSVLHELGQETAAARCYFQALRLDPKHALARNCFGLSLLASGQWTAEAWEAYEARWSSGSLRPLAFPCPLWDGSPSAGKHLVLWPEQGHGDNIMMFRYAEFLAAQGTEVTVLAAAPLLELFRRRHPGIRVVAAESFDAGVKEGRWPAPDFHAPLMGLLRILGVTPERILSPAAYLFPRPGPRPAELPFGEFQVGLAWAGNPAHVNDHHRSIPGFELLLPWLQIPGIRFHSLLKGAREDECLEHGVPQPAKSFRDFDDTAAFLQHLDLVISVDTSVAHLAGALGKPTWLLLPAVPEWRWHPYRDTTPWYPSMRLFIQKTRGDWPGVIAQVAEELQITRNKSSVISHGGTEAQR